MIVTIITLFSSIIEASVLLGLVGSMFSNRYRKSVSIIGFLIAISLGSIAINNIGLNIYLHSLVLIILFLILSQILYRGHIYIKLFYLLFGNYICIVSEVVLANIIIMLPDEKAKNLLSNINSATYFTILIKTIVIILGIISAKYFNRLNPKLPKKYWFALDLIFIIFIEILQLSMFIEVNIKNVILEYSLYSILMTIGILVLSIYVFYFLVKICWVYEKQTEFELYKLRSSELEKIIAYRQQSEDELKRIKHDIKKNLTNISYLLEKEKVSESVLYLNNITNVLEDIKDVAYSGNYVIDAILNYRITLCNNKNINLKLSIDEVKDFNIKPVDISAILDNLLDNSIEAVENLDNENKYIKLKIFYYKNNLVLVIRNPYKGNLIMKSNEIITKKQDFSNHGYGLRSIKAAINRNSGTYKVYTGDNIFSTIVMLPKNNET